MRSCERCGSLLEFETVLLPISPVPSAIGTNARVTRSDAEAIRADLCQLDAKVSQFDDAINRTQKLLDELVRRRAESRKVARKYAKQHKPLISSIRVLPPELLSEIFLMAIPWKDEIQWLYQLKNAVLLLGNVCKSWREIAVSTPRLWTSISVYFDAANVEDETQMLLRWLRRSSACPISLAIIMAAYVSFQPRMLTACDSLIEQADRLESAKFYIHPDLLRALWPNRTKFSRLHSLDITIHDRYRSFFSRSFVSPSTIDIFADTPRLFSLKINNIQPTSLLVPWSQLTSLELSSLHTLDEYYEALRQTPNLLDCSLDVDVSAFESPHNPIRLPLLQTLAITDTGDVSDLLQALELDALRRLIYHTGAEKEEGDWPQLALISLLSRSRFSLQTLDMTFTEDSETYVPHPSEFIDLLRCIPSLTHLTLRLEAIATLDKESLLQLTRPEIWQCHVELELVPKLEILTLEFMPVLDWESCLFLDFIASRRDLTKIGDSIDKSLLKTLELIDHPFEYDSDLISSLRDLASGGLELIEDFEVGDDWGVSGDDYETSDYEWHSGDTRDSCDSSDVDE